MKFIAILLLLLIPVNVWSACSIPEALEYQWGSVADTNNGQITAWRHATDPQPNQAQIDAAITLCTKETARTDKTSALNAKGIEHICRTSGLCYDSWNELVIAFHDWSSMAPAARQATASKSKATAHYQPWLDAKTTLDNYTGLNSIAFFNVSTMVSWP